ncbi:MAG: hypothetical protein DMG06_14835 [Acidobacteria bacterium]|nr:MAG: hypothetical protein DMG06_14835 [Acidobacteriota bacterium]
MYASETNLPMGAQTMSTARCDLNAEEVISASLGANDRMYTISQAALRLQLPITWLYQRTRKQTIPHRKLGKYIRFTESDLSTILEMCSRGPDKEKRDGILQRA